MVELVDAVNESATLGVLDGTDIVLIACVHSRNVLNVNLAVARRSPAYCTSIGRVLLGGLSEQALIRTLNECNLIKYQSNTTTSIPDLLRIIKRDREKGWSMISQEYEKSLCSISVPLFSRTGQLLAAICVVGTPLRTSPKQMVETILPKLKLTAQRVWE
jgi:IclR family pca regulon transcriptional regulator